LKKITRHAILLFENMPERQTQPIQRAIESGRNHAEAAMLYLTALSAIPSLLAASLRLYNPKGHDIELITHREGSFHNATYNPQTREGYIPSGATVEIIGREKPILIKDMKPWGARVFVGEKGSEVKPSDHAGSNDYFLDSSEPIVLDWWRPFSEIDGTDLEIEFFEESLTQVDEHYH
jgi:hypothetical protein